MRDSLADFLRGITDRFLFWILGLLIPLYDIAIKPALPADRQLDLGVASEWGPIILFGGLAWAAFLTYHELHQQVGSPFGYLTLDAANTVIGQSADGSQVRIEPRVSFKNHWDHDIEVHVQHVTLAFDDRDMPVTIDASGEFVVPRSGATRFLHAHFFLEESLRPNYEIKVAYLVSYGPRAEPAVAEIAGTLLIETNLALHEPGKSISTFRQLRDELRRI